MTPYVTMVASNHQKQSLSGTTAHGCVAADLDHRHADPLGHRRAAGADAHSDVEARVRDSASADSDASQSERRRGAVASVQSRRQGLPFWFERRKCLAVVV
jgi:hypothetical protein